MNDDIGTLVEPAPVTFTWGAPGWYVVGVFIFLVIAVLLFAIYRHHQKNKYRRSALSWLQAREAKLSSQPAEMVYDAAMLMKRIAIGQYGRSEVAALRNNEWIKFLNRTCKSATFADSDGVWLDKILYGTEEPPNETETRAFITKTKKWIKDHRHAL